MLEPHLNRVNFFGRSLTLRGCALAFAVVVPCLLAACGGGEDDDFSDDPGTGGLYHDSMDAASWQIGPVIDGDNYSRGMPLTPRQLPGAKGWVIDLPQPSPEVGSAHYVTMKTGSLAGYTKVSMRYRIEADPGVKILPRRFPNAPSMLTLYFQRRGDSWTAKHEDYRWYASFSRQSPIVPGEFEIEARFDQNWTSVLSSSRDKNLARFQEAVAGAGRIGFVLGGGDGAGHGIYATGPARIVVTSFRLE
jgi:hypothetical protein